jgi:hypothetical protein
MRWQLVRHAGACEVDQYCPFEMARSVTGPEAKVTDDPFTR